ncbi:MAG TPA: hypothetical protein VLF89_00695 [Candidatus Saccharimonadales bacterium]|nr:hypothetical protein [Candidatus Saccharimonadales bacterium]
MNLTFKINNTIWENSKRLITQISWIRGVALIAIVNSCIATLYYYFHDQIVIYGDAESHLDIAKRVVDGLTPGAAQLGGIWLPLPHLLIAPLVYFDPLWKTGLAGSIISGICFVISSIFLFKLVYLITKNSLASFIAFLVFAFNPNILYMQATPMTELPLIIFFLLSSYYFVKYIYRENDYYSLILAGIFGFCATLSRYDGWFLVGIELTILTLRYIFYRRLWVRMQGRIILFSTVAFFGVLLWLAWDFLILGDPLYFTHSQFSANAQQHGWLAKHQLPAYHDIIASIQYYTVTAMSNVGLIVFAVALVGFIIFIVQKKHKEHLFISLLMLTPYIFYVLTLFVGQSIIFIPDITPVGFEWRLFNVRYGTMMVPFAALFFGYLFSICKTQARILLVCLFFIQFALFGIGYSRVITLADGTSGLSQAKKPDAEFWLAHHYDHGLILLDDYSRITSIIRSNLPMRNIIYIGSKPYWADSLAAPEKDATWIVMQRNDDVWVSIYENQAMQGRLYKYFRKVYTSPEILIFRRNNTPVK